jgi:hypothetical protein
VLPVSFTKKWRPIQKHESAADFGRIWHAGQGELGLGVGGANQARQQYITEADPAILIFGVGDTGNRKKAGK